MLWHELRLVAGGAEVAEPGVAAALSSPARPCPSSRAAVVGRHPDEPGRAEPGGLNSVGGRAYGYHLAWGRPQLSARGVGDATVPMDQGDMMACDTDRGWWRRTAAIAVLPFAVLGIAGCDNAGTGGEEVEQEAPVEEEAEEG